MCEYENRCFNNDKCFRCFDNKLLKLAKARYADRSNKVFSHKVANADNSCEDLENDIADELNKIPNIEEIKRSIASGALCFEKGDVLNPILSIDCKERKGNELKGRDKSISIKKSWLDKSKDEALDDNKIIALPFRFKGDRSNYIVMEAEEIISLVNTVVAYKRDNGY